MAYSLGPFTVLQSETFRLWLDSLRDKRAVNRIDTRLRRVSMGNIRDTRSAGGGIFELRIQYGLGYRLYFMRRGVEVIVLLCGGDKDSQRRDIERARRIATDWEG